MRKTIHIRYAERDDSYNIAVFLHDNWQSEYGQIVEDEYLASMSIEKRHIERLETIIKTKSGVLESFEVIKA